MVRVSNRRIRCPICGAVGLLIPSEVTEGWVICNRSEGSHTVTVTDPTARTPRWMVQRCNFLRLICDEASSDDTDELEERRRAALDRALRLGTLAPDVVKELLDRYTVERQKESEAKMEEETGMPADSPAAEYTLERYLSSLEEEKRREESKGL